MSGILVIAEQRRAELRPATLEMVTAAQSARRPGERLAVALLADDPQRFIEAVSFPGVDEIVTVQLTSPSKSMKAE